jgi:DME family drug/metabolite transporter
LGKYFTSRYSSANLFLYVLPVGALGIFPFVEFGHKSLTAWLALLAVSFVSTFIANYCYYQGLKYLEAGRASTVATIEPVIAATCAFYIYRPSSVHRVRNSR